MAVIYDLSPILNYSISLSKTDMCEICRHAPKNDHVCAEHNGKHLFSFEIFLFATKASTLTIDQTFYHPREAALELRIEIIEKLLRFQVYAAKSLLFRPCAFPSVLLIASFFSRVPPFSFPHSNFHYSEHFTGAAIAFRQISPRPTSPVNRPRTT